MITKHYNINYHTEYNDKKGKKLPKELAEEWTRMNSREAYSKGAFGAKCEKCGMKYDQTYMVHVITGTFTNGLVCRDCKKKYNMVED